jgi:hypothetical protein
MLDRDQGCPLMPCAAAQQQKNEEQSQLSTFLFRMMDLKWLSFDLFSLPIRFSKSANRRPQRRAINPG